MTFERKINAPCMVEPEIDGEILFYARHGRPKPPKINGSLNRTEYEDLHGVTSVWKMQSGWYVAPPLRGSIEAFPTHAEAIAWAMKEVERGQV